MYNSVQKGLNFIFRNCSTKHSLSKSPTFQLLCAPNYTKLLSAGLFLFIIEWNHFQRQTSLILKMLIFNRSQMNLYNFHQMEAKFWLFPWTKYTNHCVEYGLPATAIKHLVASSSLMQMRVFLRDITLLQNNFVTFLSYCKNT